MVKKILVVDSERQIVRLVGNALRKAGYDVVEAFDGVEALKKVESEKPDMMITEVVLPRMNGFDVLKRLQADPETENMPVIMLTQKAQEADIFAGWQSGVSSYVTKPFNLLEVLTFVGSIFESIDDGFRFDRQTGHVTL